MYWWLDIIVIILFGIINILVWRSRTPVTVPPAPSDYERARLAYQLSMDNFAEATDPQYIDIAISDLGISENRVNNEIRKIRLEGGGMREEVRWIKEVCDADWVSRASSRLKGYFESRTVEQAMQAYEIFEGRSA